MPAAAVAIPAVISAGSSIGQIASSARDAKRLRSQIENYERQELSNPYSSLQVSTLGADRQIEDNARNVSTIANAAAQGGARAIMGVAPTLLAQTNAQNAQIAANLDQQELVRQQAVAQGDAQVQSLVEARENNDLLGLGNMYQAAEAQKAAGIRGLAQTAASAMQGFGELGKSTPATTPVVTPNPVTAITPPLVKPGLDLTNSKLDITKIAGDLAQSGLLKFFNKKKTV